jgi:hypothetical protein
VDYSPTYSAQVYFAILNLALPLSPEGNFLTEG